MSRDVVVRCVHGLEWVCADEVTAVVRGAGRVRLGRREVALRIPRLDPALLELRTADDVFLHVGEVSGAGAGRAAPGAIAAATERLPWRDRVEDVRLLRDLPEAPVLDVVASVEGRHRFSRFDVEAAIGSRLSSLLGGGYLRRTASGREAGHPDLTVRVFVRQQEVSFAVRLSADPLHRRAYKVATGPGTLHPPLAAAMIRLVDPAPGATVLDPFCGDGTIVIEAALAVPGVAATGRDLDPQRVANARENSVLAGVVVRVEQADAGSPDASDPVYDAIVTNPPWGLAVDAAGTLRGSLGHVWDRLPDLLAWAGRLAVVADAELDVAQALTARGCRIGLVNPVRLAGRVSHLVVAAPAGRPTPAVPERMLEWRQRAGEINLLSAGGR